MIANASTMQPSAAPSKREAPRKIAVSDPRTRDGLWEAAGEGYDAIPGKDARKAKAVGVSAQTWSKREAGQRSSPLSRALEATYEAAVEARCLEAAEMVSAYIDATCKSVCMWPELQKKQTRELVAIKAETYRRETEIQGQLDVLQMRSAQGLPVCAETERRLWTEQAALSERMMAVLDVLADRPDYI